MLHRSVSMSAAAAASPLRRVQQVAAHTIMATPTATAAAVASVKCTHYSPSFPKSFHTSSTLSSSLSATTATTTSAAASVPVDSSNYAYISICSFNILAPCYKRVSPRRLESDAPSEWLIRHQLIANFLHTIDANIYCLQEYWFGNPRFRGVYERDDQLTARYKYYGLCRPNYKEDGIMTLVRGDYDSELDAAAQQQQQQQQQEPLNSNSSTLFSSLPVKQQLPVSILTAEQQACKHSHNIDLRVVDTVHLSYSLSGSRVAMLMRVQVRQRITAAAAAAAAASTTTPEQHAAQHQSEEQPSSNSNSNSSHSNHSSPHNTDYTVLGELIVCNTHLTFPHGLYDNIQREKQISALTVLVDKYIADHSLHGIATMIVGDMNVDAANVSDDGVYQHLLANGYSSSYCSVHGVEPGVTHLTHKGTQLAVDFIMFRQVLPEAAAETATTATTAATTATTTGAVTPAATPSHLLVLTAVSSVVLPEGTDHLQWPTEFKISDHRPLLSTFAFQLPQQ